MLFGRKFAVLVAVLAFLVLIPVTLHATPRKVHVVALGAVKRVPYSKTGDPAGAKTGEDSLKIRPLVVDGTVKEWTTGESHDVTDRSFVVRRVLRINDELARRETREGRNALGLAARPLAAGRSRFGPHRCAEVTGLRSRRKSGGLVPRLCSLLRRHYQRKESLCRCLPVGCPQASACKEARRV